MTVPLPPPRMSWASVLATLPLGEQRELLSVLGTDADRIMTDWRLIARREQLPPEGDDWSIWFPLGGRGSGKTRAGSEWLIAEHRFHGAMNSAIIGSTTNDVRKLCLAGPSGILTCAPNEFRPVHKKQDMKLVWPNGTETHLYTAEEPERLRGPNHDIAWCDELAAWKYLDETWDMLEMTLRASAHPRVLITTTPKPRKRVREILSDPETIITHMTTYDNAVNLSKKFLHRVKRRYEGTALGQQEIYAVMLDECEGALWKREWFDKGRRIHGFSEPLRRVCVAIDPPATDTEESNEAGIIVAAATVNNRGAVLADRSGQMSPAKWARAAIQAYFEFHANAIVAERNNGGQMVEHTLRSTAEEMYRLGEIQTASIPIYTVWASQGKFARAEPVSALYERGEVFHLNTFNQLEDQCCVRHDTLVATARGQVPIDSLRWDDAILTRKGYCALRRVWRVGAKDSYRVQLDTGHFFYATEDHPVYVEGEGFVEVQQLKMGGKCIVTSLSIGEFDTMLRAPIGGPVARGEVGYSIELFGKTSVEKSRKGITSTTLTEMGETGISKISNCCPKEIMCGCTITSVRENIATNSYPRFRKKIGNYASRARSDAQDAVVNSYPQDSAQSTTLPPVGNGHIISVTKCEPTEVWDLSVEGEHEFFANGVLVHNCTWEPNSGFRSPDRLDALVWALTWLLIQGDTAPIVAPVGIGQTSYWKERG